MNYVVVHLFLYYHTICPSWSNPWPPDDQSDMHPTEPPRHKKNINNILLKKRLICSYVLKILPGPSCSKLTTSLVNNSLKFTWVIRKYAKIFCWKNVSSFCSAKATHIFSAKNIRILYIESAKTVNEMTLNELVKLTTLWTTVPCMLSFNTMTFFSWYYNCNGQHNSYSSNKPNQ